MFQKEPGSYLTLQCSRAGLSPLWLSPFLRKFNALIRAQAFTVWAAQPLCTCFLLWKMMLIRTYLLRFFWRLNELMFIKCLEKHLANGKCFKHFSHYPPIIIISIPRFFLNQELACVLKVIHHSISCPSASSREEGIAPFELGKCVF